MGFREAGHVAGAVRTCACPLLEGRASHRWECRRADRMGSRPDRGLTPRRVCSDRGPPRPRHLRAALPRGALRARGIAASARPCEKNGRSAVLSDLGLRYPRHDGGAVEP